MSRIFGCEKRSVGDKKILLKRRAERDHEKISPVEKDDLEKKKWIWFETMDDVKRWRAREHLVMDVLPRRIFQKHFCFVLY